MRGQGRSNDPVGLEVANLFRAKRECTLQAGRTTKEGTRKKLRTGIGTRKSEGEGHVTARGGNSMFGMGLRHIRTRGEGKNGQKEGVQRKIALGVWTVKLGDGGNL